MGLTARQRGTLLVAARPAPAVASQGISAEELRAETRHGHKTAYTVGGVLLGGGAGLIGGGLLGAKAAANAERDAAIRRILARRAAADTVER